MWFDEQANLIHHDAPTFVNEATMLALSYSEFSNAFIRIEKSLIRVREAAASMLFPWDDAHCVSIKRLYGENITDSDIAAIASMKNLEKLDGVNRYANKAFSEYHDLCMDLVNESDPDRIAERVKHAKNHYERLKVLHARAVRMKAAAAMRPRKRKSSQEAT